MITTKGITGTVGSKGIAGVANYSEEQHVEFSRWKTLVSEVYTKYGFTPFESRMLERGSELNKKGGLGHEIYTIKPYMEGKGVREGNQQAETLCLPFDHTVPLAIFIANNADTKLPLRRQDCGYSWRVETPQAGRFLSFIQADVDIIDRNLNILAEMECIMAIIQALKALEIPDFHTYLNHIGIAKGLISTLGLSEENNDAALRIIDKLDKISNEDAVKQLMDLGPNVTVENVESLVEMFSFRGAITDFVKKHSSDERMSANVHKFCEDVEELVALMTESGADPKILQFCPGMVRGLDYYTGIVFETFIDKAPNRGSIASGGRYDNLVSAISDSKITGNIQGFGGSIGLTRLFDVCIREGLVTPKLKTSSKVMICQRKVRGELNKKLRMESTKLAGRLRALNIPTELFTKPNQKVKKQLDYADNKGYPFVVMVMEVNAFVVKNMMKHQQTEVSSIDLVVSKVQNQIKNMQL